MDFGSRKRKKKSLVQTVKKKFKNNPSKTLGTRLDTDMHEYFLRVFQQSKQEFSDYDERGIFIDNVISQTKGHEVEYSSNELASRVIESLLPECSETILHNYLKVFGDDLRPICCHQFSSHVLETLLKISAKKVLELSSNDVGENVINESAPCNRETYLNFVLKVSKFMLNNLDEFILDVYANYVTRCVVSCLAGNIEELGKNSRISAKREKQLYEVNFSRSFDKTRYPSEFELLLHQFADRILNSHMFSEYTKNVLLSGLVQSVLLSLYFIKNKKYLNSISLKLIDTLYSPDVKGFDMMQILSNQEAVHLLNTMIVSSTDKVYKNIQCRCFTGRLKDMALSRTANYAVQKLIERSSDVESFDSIYDELRDSFQEIVENRHTGVLFLISKMCHKLHTKEKSFIKDLKRSLLPHDSKEADKKTVNFVLRLLTLGQSVQGCGTIASNNFVISLHGSLILQELMKFSKPDKVIKSLLDIQSSQFLQILCDQKGSHIGNAFFSSSTKKDEYKNKFLEKLKGSYVTLAMNKYGSFVFNALWKVADIDQKLYIVKELIIKESLVLNNPCGKYIAKAVGLQTYRHQPKEWENAQKQVLNSRQIFSDIII